MLTNLDKRLAKALRFWRVRNRQHQRQGSASGRRDSGNRAAVTGGGHCDGFANLIRDIFVDCGVPQSNVFHKKNKAGIEGCDTNGSRKGTQLPGWFRATKDWDLIVVADNELLASIEFKSHIGPSFGNNFNNRAEEAIGNALDIAKAYREGAFKVSQKPWLGYFMLLEDVRESTSPVKVKEPHFPVFPEFFNSSYEQRYVLLCQRLVREQLYDSACLIMSDKKRGATGRYREPDPELSFLNFVSSLSAKAMAFAQKRRQKNLR